MALPRFCTRRLTLPQSWKGRSERRGTQLVAICNHTTFHCISKDKQNGVVIMRLGGLWVCCVAGINEVCNVFRGPQET